MKKKKNKNPQKFSTLVWRVGDKNRKAFQVNLLLFPCHWWTLNSSRCLWKGVDITIPAQADFFQPSIQGTYWAEGDFPLWDWTEGSILCELIESIFWLTFLLLAWAAFCGHEFHRCNKSMQASPRVLHEGLGQCMTYVLAASESSHCEDVEVSWRGKKGNYPQINLIFLGFCRVGLFFCFF